MNDCQPALNRRQLAALLGVFGLSPDVLHAQDAAKVAPHLYRVVLENDKVRVLEYASEPGTGVCGVGKHWHPGHVTVQLTPVKVRLTPEGGGPTEIDVPAGAVFWEPAVTHTTENVGRGSAHAYVIEIKDANWKPATGTT
jgi:hypothetical protein